MKKTNEMINVIQCVVMVVLLLLILSILIALPTGQGVASAEGTSTLTPEEESALLTESDDVEGYAGICPNIGSIAGHVANSNMLVNNSAGCVFELDLLTDAQKVNCGGTDRQYGYEG